MNVEIPCEGCGRNLLVPADYEGTEVGCPSCGKLIDYRKNRPPVGYPEAQAPPRSSAPTVPHTESPTPDEHTSEFDSQEYFLRIPEGQTFGPVDRTQLDSWVTDGRISHECEIYVNFQWVPAATIYDELNPAHLPIQADQVALAREPVLVREPLLQPVTQPLVPGSIRESYAFVAPHRGPLIFGLALCGLVVWCPVLSFIAWVTGTSDLVEMDEGRRDSGGRTMTRFGRNLGMILAILWMIAAGVGVLAVLIYTAASG